MASNAGRKRGFRIVGQDHDDTAGEPTRPHTALGLADLKRVSASELERWYRLAEAPKDIKGLDGPLPGTLLTLAGPLSQGMARVITNRVAGSDRFPWAGKTFQSWAEDRGSGINRVKVLGERLWFHFETRIGSSAIDGQPCIVLDYDHAENPWPVRQICDELRQVGPGLWFGPATAFGRTLLYFAVRSPRSEGTE